MAKFVKQRQPRLYDFLYQNRYKHTATDLLDVGSFKPVVHVSGRFAAKHHCLAIVLPLCEHPLRKTEIIVYDLSVDPAPLLELSAEEIQQRVFTATADLAESVERIPLKTIHINKYPVIAPYNVIRPADAERLKLDLANCQRNLQTIQAQAAGLNSKLAQVFGRQYGEGSQDPDLMIYSGGFFTPQDKATINKIRQTAPEKLGSFKADFVDGRLEEMLFRYRGRNYPNTLNSEELQQWQQFCQQRLDVNTLESYKIKLLDLQTSYGEDHPILKQLLAFAQSKQNSL
jgi:exodeoxyribonuclease-1